jgi:arginine decarboxylase
MARWTPADSEELYNVLGWGAGFFRVNAAGNVAMTPPGLPSTRAIDLKILIDDLQRRGIQLPILVRFTDLVRARLETLVTAFGNAIREYEYQGRYRGVYPIKVNQQRHLVEDLVRFSEPHHLGLEAGSKPELMVVLAMLEDPEALIICNGYKDREYIEMALLARKLGRNCIIVVEKSDEVDLVLEAGKRLEVEPVIGVRAKLSSKGTGRWQSSAGDRAKFGLTITEIVELVEKLRKSGDLGILQLLHFHIGSQISAIRAIKQAMREATRVYTELHRMGAPMRYMDVGGGLGVDYDGSRTNFASSMNYDTQEYAYDVVAAIKDACENAGMPHPDIITEAGRATVSHNSVLIFNVLGVSEMVADHRPAPPGEDADENLKELWELYESISAKNLQEPFHDAQEIKEESLTRFNLGLTTLEERARIERMYWAICHKLARTAKDAEYVPEDLEPLEQAMADTFFCNFSVFQSAPDAWAIGQLFPVLPIHRLQDEPMRRAVLADITCDSDGKLSKFIDRRDVKHVLELHEPNGQPYYIGMFLLGAYQEILGDLHNLFGDTNAVHVSAVEGGLGYRIDHLVEGDTVKEVLDYVEYDRARLIQRLRRAIESGIENERLTMEEGARLIDTYTRGLDGYTYLEAQPSRLGKGS